MVDWPQAVDSSSTVFAAATHNECPPLTPRAVVEPSRNDLWSLLCDYVASPRGVRRHFQSPSLPLGAELRTPLGPPPQSSRSKPSPPRALLLSEDASCLHILQRNFEIESKAENQMTHSSRYCRTGSVGDFTMTWSSKRKVTKIILVLQLSSKLIIQKTFALRLGVKLGLFRGFLESR